MSEWPLVTLKQLTDRGIVKLGRGKIISKKDLAAKPGTYPVYSSAKQNEGKFGEYGEYMFDEEMITWSVDGGGRLFHRNKHRFSVTNVGGTMRILDQGVLNYSFLYYVLTHLHSQIDFDWVRKAHPSVILKLYNEIPLPPLSEQRRIVSVLDAAFAGLATATAHTQKNLQNARELFDSCLNTAFEDEPEDWLRKPLVDLTTKIGSGATPRGGKTVYKTEGISLIRSMNVHDAEFREKNLAFIDDEQASKLSHVQVEVDDVLLNITGASVARCCNAPEDILPAVVNQHVSIIRPKTQMLDSDFLQLALISKPHKDRLLGIGDAGATRQAITKGQIKAFEIAFPAQIDEQKKVVNQLRILHSEVEKLAKISTRKLAALSEFKQSLLHRAFRGELSGGAAQGRASKSRAGVSA